MATCTKCGSKAGFMMSLCDRCNTTIRLALSIDRHSQLSPDLVLYVTDGQGNMLQTLRPSDTVVCWLPGASTSFTFGSEHNQVRFALPPGQDPSDGVAGHTAVMYWDGGGWHCNFDGRNSGMPRAAPNVERVVESVLVTPYFTTTGLGCLAFFGWLSIIGGVVTGILWSAELDAPASGLVLFAALVNGGLVGGFLLLVRGIGHTVLDLVRAQHAAASPPPMTSGEVDTTGGPPSRVRRPMDY